MTSEPRAPIADATVPAPSAMIFVSPSAG